MLAMFRESNRCRLARRLSWDGGKRRRDAPRALIGALKRTVGKGAVRS